MPACFNTVHNHLLRVWEVTFANGFTKDINRSSIVPRFSLVISQYFRSAFAGQSSDSWNGGIIKIELLLDTEVVFCLELILI